MNITSKNFIKQYSPAIFLVLFYTFFHIILSPDYWDDAQYRKALGGSILNLYPFLYSGYMLQTSRTAIEFVTGILSLLPYGVWKILDLLIILLLYNDIEWFQENVFQTSSSKARWGISLLLCSLPFSIMASAGWMATTLNYLWVISLGWYAVNRIIKNVVLEVELSFQERVLTILAVLYSGCFESVTVLMLIGVITAIVYAKKKNKSVSGILWIILVIIILFLVEIFICPGNRNRMESDVGYWMADYAQMNLFDKLRMGIVMAFMHFVSIPSPIFFMLNGTCFLIAIMKKGTLLQKLTATLPIILDIFWTCYFVINYLTGNKVMTYQAPNALLTGGIDTVEQIVMLITVILWFGSLLYSFYWMLPEKKDFYLCFAVLLIGCMPELVVGMSATVTNSMLRTVIYLYLSMILLILCIWKEGQVFWQKYLWFRIAIYFTFTFGIALNALQMLRHILIYG